MGHSWLPGGGSVGVGDILGTFRFYIKRKTFMFADKYDYKVFLSSESIPFKIKIHKIRTTPLFPKSGLSAVAVLGHRGGERGRGGGGGRKRPYRNIYLEHLTEPVFLNVNGAHDSIPRNEFHQPM